MHKIPANNHLSEEVLVYIEHYSGKLKEVVFDFIDANEHNEFLITTGYSDFKAKPSIVWVTDYQSDRIQSNTIYAIKKETLRNLMRQDVILEPIEDSYIFGFRMRMHKNVGKLFDRSVRLSIREKIARGIQLGSQHENAKIPDSYHEDLKVVVRNVGQGNWNELLCRDKVVLVYDIGTNMHASKKEVATVIDNKDTVYQNSSPGLIISHWDVDHYQCLLGLEDNTIKQLSFFLCRDHFPTKTSQSVRDRVRKHLNNNVLFFVPYERRINKRGSVELILLSSETNQLKIFNAAKHRDRNQSGIVLTVETSKSSVIFSGDAHYDQLSDYVLPNITIANSVNNLIVPHHGGYAGKYIYKLDAGVQPGNAAISVGVNIYRHPLQGVSRKLLNQGFSLEITRFANSDIVIKL